MPGTFLKAVHVLFYILACFVRYVFMFLEQLGWSEDFRSSAEQLEVLLPSHTSSA